MVRFLIRAAIFLASAAIGLLCAALLLPEVSLSGEGFVIVIVVFAIVQSILGPFLFKIASQNARAFLGGIGLVATFIALLVANLIPGGITITGWRTWILCTLVVWLVTAVASFFLPILFLKKKVVRAR